MTVQSSWKKVCAQCAENCQNFWVGGCLSGIVGGAGASSGCLRNRCSAVRITLVLTRFPGIRVCIPLAMEWPNRGRSVGPGRPNRGCSYCSFPRSVVLRSLFSQVDSPCLVWWDALDGLTVALRWRMSCVRPVTAWRPPALVRLTLGASVPQSCGYHARPF